MKPITDIKKLKEKKVYLHHIILGVCVFGEVFSIGGNRNN